MSTTFRWPRILAGAALAALTAATAGAQAVISNGTVRMGIRQFGDLNTGSLPQVTGTSTVGLRLITARGDYEATADGCTCEGWGVGVRSGGAVTSWGGSNSSVGGTTNLTAVAFVSNATSAASTVRLTSGAPLTVVHEYRPSAVSPYLYEVNVSITNTGAAGISDVVYRRVMDWDIAPTQFDEVVTLQGWNAENLVGSGNNGFLSSQPLLAGAACTIAIAGAACDANFTTTGVGDQGSFFDFSFGALGAGETRAFQTFYGAAPTRAELFSALGAAGAEVFTAAWCGGGAPGSSPTSCNGVDGPAVFGYGFRGVGGTVPPDLTIPEPSTYAMVGAGLAGLGAAARRRRRTA